MTFNSTCVVATHPELTTVPHNLPIYATTSFNFHTIEQGINIFEGQESGHFYSRYANPTVDTVGDKIAALEAYGLDGVEAAGVMVSSGMAAISTLMLGVLQAGDAILTQQNLYGGTTELFTKILQPIGIQVIMVDLTDLETVEKTLKSTPSVKMLFFETPANPTLSCVDIAALTDLAHQHGAFAAIDNTFCTPYLQQPFQFGVDFIIHSTTKFINGHGNSTAGIIIGRDVELMRTKIWQSMKLTGTNCSPFEAWLTYNGLKTMPLRMKKHCENALAIAEFLETHPSVLKVNYPALTSHSSHVIAKKQMKNGFGAMLSFELKGGMEAGMQFMNKVKLCSLAPTLGDVDTLILHPASSSHRAVPKNIREANGITDGLVRLSVGIEDAEDIIADLAQAMGD
jgi:methionine-gamma-lyase